VLSLLLGGILTLAVSWLAAAFADVTGSAFLPNPNSASLAYMRTQPPGDWTVRTWLVRRGVGIRHDLVSECVWMGSTLGWSESTRPNRTREVASVGWPLPAMQWTTGESPGPWTPARWKDLTLAGAWRGGLPQPTMRALAMGDERRVPVRPVPVGFAVDVALFAAASWWGVEWWTRARTRRRLARGACVGCGYDLQGLTAESTSCPECGRARSSRTSPATIPA
jgi:predicted RNA-binding Zn-ribbon protein involved in translation (DUF1610 family)